MSATSFSLVNYLAAVDVKRKTDPLLVPQKGLIFFYKLQSTFREL